MYITGDVYPAYSPHTFATETLGNAISTTGSAYNYASVSTYYQLGGLDQISNLYASGTNSSGATTLYLVSNLSNLQSGSAPTLTALTSLSGTLAIINDLSDGSLSSIVLPEPATWGGGRFRSRAGGGRDAAATGQEAANSVRAHLLK